jgi:hypothetical protein
VEIKEENVGVHLLMGLGHKGPNPTPRPDRGQSPQSRGSGPCRQRLYNGHVNQRSLQARKVEHYTDGPIPYNVVAVVCTTTVTPFFLYTGAASSSRSTSSPKIWNPLTLYRSRGSRSTNEFIDKNSASLNPS